MGPQIGDRSHFPTFSYPFSRARKACRGFRARFRWGAPFSRRVRSAHLTSPLHKGQLTPTEKKRHHYQQTNTLFFASTRKRVFFQREGERKKTQFLEREIVWLWGFGLGFSFLLGGDNRDWVFLEGDNSHGTFWNYLFIFSSSLFLEGVVIGLGCVVVALSDCKFDGFCLVS